MIIDLRVLPGKGEYMRRYLTLLILASIGLNGHGFQKQQLDITDTNPSALNEPTGLARIPFPGIDYLELTNAVMEADLLRSGHFTLGTALGTDQGPLDDHQSLTFGHPLAKTSYPLLEVDGSMYRLDTYFDASQINISRVGEDQIRMIASNGVLSAIFAIALDSQSENILHLVLNITNLDASNHSVRCGFVFDPALGTWGDGVIKIENTTLTNTTLYENNTAISAIQIDERPYLNTGMRLLINFPSSTLPNEILVDNWSPLAGYPAPEVSELYDAAIQWRSGLLDLAPGTDLASLFDLELAAGNYPDGPFIRSQLPQMLESYGNVVFPSHSNCFTVIENSSTSLFDATLTLRSDYLFDAWSSDPFLVDALGKTYQTVPLNIPECYEDRVYPVTLELTSGTNLLDVIEQNLLVPASAYSDTGLLILSDSLILADYPDVSLRFNVTVESTGQYISNLTRQNLSVWEGQSRINDFSLVPDTTSGTNAIDVVFVLDVTGSMGEEISGVRNNVSTFATALETAGLDFRLAMITFLDEIENIYDFTSDVSVFQAAVNLQTPHGGGALPENSLDALFAATQLQFRPEAGRVFIWITDAVYHINNTYTSLTPVQVVDAMLANSVVCHSVAPAEFRVEYYDPIIVPTGGDWYDINGNFLDILLDIAALGGTTKYLLNYSSPNTDSDPRAIMWEVHTAGLGGYATLTYTPPAASLARNLALDIRCFPNPFNPSINIELNVPTGLKAQAAIYNIRGQLVQSYPVTPSGSTRLRWEASDQQGRNVPAGLYLVQISLTDDLGVEHSRELIKIVHTN